MMDLVRNGMRKGIFMGFSWDFYGIFMGFHDDGIMLIVSCVPAWQKFCGADDWYTNVYHHVFAKQSSLLTNQWEKDIYDVDFHQQWGLNELKMIIE